MLTTSLKALLSKILNALAEANSDHIVIGNTIGICWGTATITANSAAAPTLPITYSTTNGMVCVASCNYLSGGTYVAPTVSVQKYTNHINLYARCSTSTVQNGYQIDWLTIGLL